MYEDTNREICMALEVERRTRDQYGRVPTLLAAIDQLLTELEELRLVGVDEAPAAQRTRAAKLIGEAQRVPAELVRLPRRIDDLAGLLLDAEEPLLRESIRLRAKARQAKRVALGPGRAA